MTRAKCRASRGVDVVRAQSHARSITGSVGCANVASISGDRPVADPRQEALGMTDPTPDEVPPVTTPVDPEVLATPDSGLDWRPGPPKQVVIIGAGLAGLVAAFELKRQGHDVDRPRGAEPGRRPDLHAALVRARPLRRGRRDAHPAGPRPDAAVLRPVRPAAAPVRHGQSQGRSSTSAASRMTKEEADARPWSPAVHRRGARARPQRRRALGIGDRRPASDGRERRRRRVGAHRARVRPVLALRVPAPQGLVARARSSTTPS